MDTSFNIVKINQLMKLKKTIELMDKNDHIEIAVILKKNSEYINENNNGIFINLNTIKDSTIGEINNYLEFVKTQDVIIKKQEILKENIENTYFKTNDKTI